MAKSIFFFESCFILLCILFVYNLNYVASLSNETNFEDDFFSTTPISADIDRQTFGETMLLLLTMVIFLFISFYCVLVFVGWYKNEKGGSILLTLSLALIAGGMLIGINCGVKTLSKNVRSVKLSNIVIKTLICILSITSAFALSNSIKLEPDKLNPIIAINCSIISLLLSCVRAGLMVVDRNISRERSHESDADRNSNFISSFGLLYAVLFASLSDALFDITQGLALYFDQNYTSQAFKLLIAATFIGAAEELIDLALDIIPVCVDCIHEAKDHYKCVLLFICVLFFAGVFTEISIGIYLATTYDNLGIQIISFFLQAVFVLLSCVLFIPSLKTML